jgi:DNA-binding SARP family transcriptional activator
VAISATNNAAQPIVEVRVLGPLEVVGPEGPIAIGSARQRAILALLVLAAGRVVSVARLVDELWGERPPASADHALRVHIAGLRRALGPALIDTLPGGYRLRSGAAIVDFRQFEAFTAQGGRAAERGDSAAAASAYRAALDLWRGPALSNVDGVEGAESERVRLDEMRASAVDHWLDAALAAGEHLDLIPELRRLIAESPLRESLRARLMVALYRAGRQADALHVYADARALLDSELGVEPGPELEAAQRAVLGHAADLQLPATPTVRDAGTREQPTAPAVAGGDARDGVDNGSRTTDERVAAAHPTRRTITALAALVSTGSTRRDLDPESADRPSASLIDDLRATVARHQGILLTPPGGPLVQAVFGVPTLHDDDAVRAVRAAAEMRDAVAMVVRDMGRIAPERSRLRVGVTTGEVLVSDVAGSNLQVAGEAPSAAAVLAAAAKPGDILISDATYRLVRRVAETEAHTSIRVAGSPPMPVRRLVSVPTEIGGNQPRLEAPLVGRSREIRQLEATFESVIEEQSCHLFTLLGPAGIGKSRLVHEFLRTVGSDQVVLRGRCRPYGEQIAFGPLADVVRKASSIESGDDIATARARIQAALAGHPRSAIAAGRVAAAIGLGTETSTPEETLWAVRTFLERLARSATLVVVFDDIQWGEPGFLDLVEQLAATIRDVPVLLVCIGRPELLDVRPGWAGGVVRSTSAVLRPLDAADCSRLVAELLDDRPASPALAAAIAGATAGNPLFVEELVTELAESGAVRLDGDTYVPATDLASVRTPASILALLSARLDRLPETERSAVESAAVVGEIFSLDALSAITDGMSRDAIERSVAGLSRREIVRSEASAGDSDLYRFRHILLRDAAYAEIPKRVRISAHERLADWLATEGTSGTDLDDELIGAHLETAFATRQELGLVGERTPEIGRRSATHFAAAGARAFTRGQTRTAAALLARAAALLPIDDPERLAVLAELEEAHIERADASAFHAVNDDLAAGARRLGRDDLHWHATLAQIHWRMVFEELPISGEMRAQVRAGIGYFAHVRDQRSLGRAWFLLGSLDGDQGRFAAGRPAFQEALRHANLAGDIRTEARVRAELASIDREGPTPVAAALRTGAELLAWARSNSQLATEATALANLGRLKAMAGDFDAGRQLARSGGEMAAELQGDMVAALAEVNWIGYVEYLSGDLGAAEAHIRRSLEIYERLGMAGSTSFVRALLARMLYLQGRLPEADALIGMPDTSDDANAFVEMAWLGVRALTVGAAGDHEAADSLARRAVARAGEQDWVFWRGLTMEDLAEVLRLAGRTKEAVSALAEAIEIYEQKGFVGLAARARLRPSRHV